ncbi:MAG: PadR family transcriptional regulator [Candidatus Dormibacteraeota bacterium]|nr:PadR family transcriptional regulator [Candidatus Dormibacteraeota bacterium]
MSSGASQMFVPGLLARPGPLHGHALRQMAHQDHTELGTDVKVGSLYGAMRQLSAEGLRAARRTEQGGRQPTRTVDAASAAGRRELERVRRAVLPDAQLRPAPFDLALALLDRAPGQDLPELVRRSKAAIQAAMEARRRLGAKPWPHLAGPEREVFRRYRHRYQAEPNWHAERLAPTTDRGNAGPPRGPDPTRPPAPTRRRLGTPAKGGSLGAGEGARVGSGRPAPTAANEWEPER